MVMTSLLLFLHHDVQAQSTFKYSPGQGVQWHSTDSLAAFRILGYVQSTGNVNFYARGNNPSNEFNVRRARIDLDFDYRDPYQVFFEFDAKGSRTEMVLAQLDVKYGNNHYVRVGKFITPFSAENLRSSRSLSTIERYTALNSMFLLPALNTQYGVMLLGQASNASYYLSLTNGNGKASQNISENNSAKDIQGELATLFLMPGMEGPVLIIRLKIPKNFNSWTINLMHLTL